MLGYEAGGGGEGGRRAPRYSKGHGATKAWCRFCTHIRVLYIGTKRGQVEFEY